ncbi:MAG: DUF4185 domain-containing protein, partial [Alistipes sp.]
KRQGYCYMIGTHIGRQGSAYLARFRQEDICRQSSYEYWNGLKNRWIVGDEKSATAIFDGTIGELSFAYLEKYRCWIVLYFDVQRYAICYRTATTLNGAWSAEQMLVDGDIYPASTNGDEIYYTMSQWYPYNVFLMRAKIVLR